MHTEDRNASLMNKTSVLFLCALTAFVGYLFGTMRSGLGQHVETPATDIVQQRAETGTARLHGEDVRMDAGMLHMKLVEWVQGSDEQEQAALESGLCTLERIESDECLPNGFFIRTTGKVLEAPLAEEVKVAVLSPGPSGEITQDAQSNTVPRNIEIDVLKRMLADPDFASQAVFAVTTRHGKAVAIEEMYVP